MRRAKLRVRVLAGALALAAAACASPIASDAWPDPVLQAARFRAAAAGLGIPLGDDRPDHGEQPSR